MRKVKCEVCGKCNPRDLKQPEVVNGYTYVTWYHCDVENDSFPIEKVAE